MNTSSPLPITSLFWFTSVTQSTRRREYRKRRRLKRNNDCPWLYMYYNLLVLCISVEIDLETNNLRSKSFTRIRRVLVGKYHVFMCILVYSALAMYLPHTRQIGACYYNWANARLEGVQYPQTFFQPTFKILH